MRFAVTGGGIAGLTVAHALSKLGIETVIFESASELRADGAGLALGSNAISAFSVLGLSEKIIIAANRIMEFSIRNPAEKSLINRYSDKILSDSFYHSYAIHRHTLHSLLTEALPAPMIFTGKKVVDFHSEANGVVLFFSDGASDNYDYVIAADGINSVFRKRLLPASYLRYAGYYCWRGVADNFSLDNPSTAVEYWGHGKRFGIVPLPESQVYWYACINKHDDDPVMLKINKDDLSSAFRDFPDPVRFLISAVPFDKILTNRISDLAPVNNYAFSRILLVGDAAHATTPNLGQGACLAIEDAAILHSLLKNSSNIINVFKNFSRIRTPRAKYIVELSRKTGDVASIENSAAIVIRDLILRMIPASLAIRQTKKILTFNPQPL